MTSGHSCRKATAKQSFFNDIVLKGSSFFYLSQVLRKPKEFLIALLQKFVELLTKSSSDVSFALLCMGLYFVSCVLYCQFRFPLSSYFSQTCLTTLNLFYLFGLLVFYSVVFVYLFLDTFLKPVWPGCCILLYLFSGWDSRDCHPGHTLSFYGTTAASRPGMCGKNCYNELEVVLSILVYSHILEDLLFSNLEESRVMLIYHA